MESTHLVLLSTHDHTINADDAMRLLLPQYDGHKLLGLDEDGIPSAESFTALLQDLLQSKGDHFIKEMFTDFGICEMCGHLTLWDNVIEDFLHLVRNPNCGVSDAEEDSLHAAPVA